MYNEIFDDKAQSENRKVFEKYFSKHGRVIHFEKGSQINIKSEKFIALVLKGKIVTGISSESGKRKDLFVDRPGEIFGFKNFFYAGKEFLFHEAKEDCSICVNSEEDFDKIVSEFPEIYKYLLSTLTEQFRIVSLELSNLLFNDSMGKVADALLRIAACSRSDYTTNSSEPEEQLEISTIFTHDELARNIGCSRTTVTLCLNKLVEQNIIELINKKICIKKPKELSEYIDKVF